MRPRIELLGCQSWISHSDGGIAKTPGRDAIRDRSLARHFYGEWRSSSSRHPPSRALRSPDRRDLPNQRQSHSHTDLADALLARDKPRRARRSPPRKQQVGAAGMDPITGAGVTDLRLPGNQPTPWRSPALSLPGVHPKPKQPKGRSLGWFAPPSGKEGGQSSDATNNTCKHQINLSFSKNLRERVNSKDTKSKGPKED